MTCAEFHLILLEPSSGRTVLVLLGMIKYPKYHWQHIVFQQSHVYYCNDKVKLCLWKAHESGALKGTKRIKYHISDQPYLYQNQINVSTDMRNHTVRLSRGPLLLPAAHSIRAARHFAESSPLHWQLPG